MELRPGYKQTEVGAIPIAWDVKPLSALPCKVIDCHHSTPVWTSSGVVVIRNQNIRAGKLDLTEPSYTDEKHYRERVRRALPAHPDLVITREAPMGQVCMISPELKCCLGQRMVLLRIRQEFANSLYVLYALQAEQVQRAIAIAGGTGSTVSNLRIPVLKSLPIPTPDRREQRAIAEALSDVDGLLGGLDRLIAKKRDLKQAAMQQLLTGQTRLPGFSGHWSLGALGDVVSSLEAGVSVNSTDAAPEHGVPCVLKTSALVGGIFLPDEAKVIVTRDIVRARATPERDTILISRMNTPILVGEIAYVPRDFDTLFLPDRLWMARFSRGKRVNVRWMAFVLCSWAYRDLLRDVATGTSGSMKNISKSALLSMPVRFPSHEEQTAIAAILSDMDAELIALEARRDKTRAVKQAMMQELLTGRTRLV